MAEIPRIVIKSRSGQPNPFIEHIKNTYERNPFDPREFVTKEGDAAFEVSSINENEARINSIRSFEKGKGAGSNVLNLLENLADEFKVELTGTAEPFGQKGLNKKKLLDFYKRHGWISKYPDDPLRSDELYRLPKARKDLPPEETPISTGLVNLIKAGSKVVKAANPVSTALQVLSPTEVADATLEGNPEVQDFVIKNFPKIRKSWWLDDLAKKDTVTLYHGTDVKNLDNIKKYGITPDADKTYLTPDPDTGIGYGSMTGGEKTFRQVGKKAKTNPIKNRVLLEIEVPKEVIFKNLDNQRSRYSKSKLLNPDSKKKFTPLNSPNEKYGGLPYYSLTEFRIEGGVPPKFIKSISTKKETKWKRHHKKKRSGGSVMERNPYDYEPRGI